MDPKGTSNSDVGLISVSSQQAVTLRLPPKIRSTNGSIGFNDVELHECCHILVYLVETVY